VSLCEKTAEAVPYPLTSDRALATKALLTRIGALARERVLSEKDDVPEKESVLEKRGLAESCEWSPEVGSKTTESMRLSVSSKDALAIQFDDTVMGLVIVCFGLASSSVSAIVTISETPPSAFTAKKDISLAVKLQSVPFLTADVIRLTVARSLSATAKTSTSELGTENPTQLSNLYRTVGTGQLASVRPDRKRTEAVAARSTRTLCHEKARPDASTEKVDVSSTSGWFLRTTPNLDAPIVQVAPPPAAVAAEGSSTSTERLAEVADPLLRSSKTRRIALEVSGMNFGCIVTGPAAAGSRFVADARWPPTDNLVPSPEMMETTDRPSERS
jgi:hypothetical protein